jgi:hypothetical protein
MKNSVCVMIISLIFVGCDKGGGSFSVLSESASFQQEITYTPRKLDVLFVVDNSGSMDSYQQALVNNFSTFIDRFITKGYDFRIAITTSEAYRYEQLAKTGNCFSFCEESRVQFRRGSSSNPYVIDRANYDLTTNAGKTLLKNDFIANAHMGTDGSGDERSFSSFIAALQYHTNNNGAPSPNKDFHRPDAFLAIVIISDEEDFSQTGVGGLNESYSNVNLVPVATYKTSLENFTGGIAGTDFTVSTISILDQACLNVLDPNNQTNPGSSIGRKIGTRYKQLADLTGGTKNSLCNSFDTSLDNISDSIEGLSDASFVLNKAPVVASIKLLVDGALVPQSPTDGWSYIAASKTVKINGSTYKPSAGATIKLTFDPDLSAP